MSFDRVKDKGLRNWLYRHDEVEKYLDRVHAMTKEEGMFTLEVASYFVPLVEIAGIARIGKLINLFRLKRGLQVTEEGAQFLYHYTSKEAAESISQEGLKVGRDGFSYLTNTSRLSPLQEQIELALPGQRALPNAIIKIDARSLKPEIIRRVTGNMPGTAAGGGTEYLFRQDIPAILIKILK